VFVQLGLAVTQKVIFLPFPSLVLFRILCELYALVMCEMRRKKFHMYKYLWRTFYEFVF